MSRRGHLRWWLLVLALPCVRAQNVPALPAPSVSEKWRLFVSETATPLTLVEAVPYAVVSQATNFAPNYGASFSRNDAFLKRFATAIPDEVSRNFFAEFVLASALHEDTRYVREGSASGKWRRAGYAISRALIARTDSGTATFNWANVGGSAMSAALSNAYYPAVSRTAGVGAVNWGADIAGVGLGNLLPEFGPDMGHWMKRHLTFHH